MTAKKLFLPVAAGILLSSTLFITPEAHAQGFGMGHPNFFSGLVQFISQKFGLDKTKVQSAVNDYRHDYKLTPRPTMSPDQVKAMEQKRLDALVQKGKITSDQEKAILSELDTLKSKYDLSKLKDETPDQRRTTLENLRNDITSWAKANNIEPRYVMPGFGMRGFGHIGMGRLGKFGGWSSTSTPTPTP